MRDELPFRPIRYPWTHGGEIDEFARECAEIAKAKGWDDVARTPAEIHMLIVSEVAEALEAVREGIPPVAYKDFNHETGERGYTTYPKIHGHGVSKPEGEAVELADAVIRIAHYFHLKGWSLRDVLAAKVDYNKTRPYRHGGKAL